MEKDDNNKEAYCSYLELPFSDDVDAITWVTLHEDLLVLSELDELEEKKDGFEGVAWEVHEQIVPLQAHNLVLELLNLFVFWRGWRVRSQLTIGGHYLHSLTENFIERLLVECEEIAVVNAGYRCTSRLLLDQR